MINVNGNLQDENTGQPLAGGTIYGSDNYGNPVALGQTDEVGNFNVTVDDTQPKLLVSAPGYAAKMIDPGDVADDGAVGLSPSALGADNATGTVQNTTASGIPWWVYV